MNESELQRIYIYRIYPRDSKIYSDKAFIYIDDGLQGGTHSTCFILKDKSYYYDSFGGATHKFLRILIPKPIIHHNYKIQDLNSNFCGSYC